MDRQWVSKAPRLAHVPAFDGIRGIGIFGVMMGHSFALDTLSFAAIVDVFFVISGFLVTQSWLARQRIVPFVAARALRIYPALIAATIVTLVLSAASSVLPLRAFLTDPLTVDYAWRVALGWEMVYRLPGAFPTNPFPHDANGSLWTLPVEITSPASASLWSKRHDQFPASDGVFRSVSTTWKFVSTRSAPTRKPVPCPLP